MIPVSYTHLSRLYDVSDGSVCVGGKDVSCLLYTSWVDRVKNGQPLTGASAWDGYMACVAAHVLGQCREEGGTAKEILLPEKPVFYQ